VRFRTARDFVLEHASNISRGGIFIETDDPPPMDAAVQVEIQLPDEPAPVTTNGVVVHRQLAVAENSRASACSSWTGATDSASGSTATWTRC